MKRIKHTGNKPITCPACITLAEQKKMPWHKDWGDSLISQYETIKAIHDKKVRP